MARLAAVGAIRIACPAQEIRCGVVAAPNQMNLRQRVEDCAGGFMELDGTPDLERPMQRFFGAVEVAEAYADLSERGERDGETMFRAVLFVKRYAAFGQGERLLMAVLHHHHIRLVAAHRSKDVGGVLSQLPAAAVGTFTTNKVKAAPVLVCQEALAALRERGGRARGIAFNSGNANAATGRQGLDNARQMARES